MWRRRRRLTQILMSMRWLSFKWDRTNFPRPIQSQIRIRSLILYSADQRANTGISEWKMSTLSMCGAAWRPRRRRGDLALGPSAGTLTRLPCKEGRITIITTLKSLRTFMRRNKDINTRISRIKGGRRLERSRQERLWVYWSMGWGARGGQVRLGGSIRRRRLIVMIIKELLARLPGWENQTLWGKRGKSSNMLMIFRRRF